MKIGARLALGGDAQHRADRLALDQDDALVADAHLRQVALHDQRLAIEQGEHLKKRVEVLVAGLDAEDAGAAIAEQRLDDDVAMLGAEGEDLVAIAGDQRRRHQPLEPRHKEFFRRIADARRVVDDQRGGVDMLQQMRRRDVGHVEGRVLAHQDHVHRGEIEGLELAETVMPATLAAHLEPASARAQPAVAQAQMRRQVMVERMAARLRFERQHEAGVAIDVDGFHRIHLDRHREPHDIPLSSPPRRPVGGGRSRVQFSRALSCCSSAAVLWRAASPLARRRNSSRAAIAAR